MREVSDAQRKHMSEAAIARCTPEWRKAGKLQMNPAIF
jgi:hypothetical protein